MKITFAFALASFVLSACASREVVDRVPQSTPTPRTFAVMGPLVIGKLDRLEGLESDDGWKLFAEQLAFYKSIGVESVSTDVWWGYVEPQDNRFRWDFYQKLVEHIAAAGLKWVPILSFHQCGGNVGDTCDVPLPDWLWRKYARVATDGIQFKSEQGNLSKESVSVWGSARAAIEFRDFMTQFQKTFADRAGMIAEINISLGPAGELRYPSYNGHDQGTGYPTRGAFQAYSGLALQDYRDYLRRKYGTVARLDQTYGRTGTRTWQDVNPPTGVVQVFDDPAVNNSPFKMDFLHWYSDSLERHGERQLRLAMSIFNNPSAPFKGIAIGAKIPGVHWRMGRMIGSRPEFSDRGAEITAGLISAKSADWNEIKGYGYRPLLEMFSRVKRDRLSAPFILHFTCLEMNDGEGDPNAQSLARSLVKWVGREAQKQRLQIKGENALAGTLGGRQAWLTMEQALEDGGYSGLTILRMDELFGNQAGRSEFTGLIDRTRRLNR